MKLRREPEEPEIPSSSMADIAFLLIVFFMVTTVFASTRGLDYLLPQQQDIQDEIEPEEAVHIKVMPDATVIVDGNPMALHEILPYLAPKLERNPDKPVMLQTLPDSPYYAMVDVYDQLKQAENAPKDGGIGLKIKNISIPTQKEIEREVVRG